MVFSYPIISNKNKKRINFRHEKLYENQIHSYFHELFFFKEIKKRTIYINGVNIDTLITVFDLMAAVIFIMVVIIYLYWKKRTTYNNTELGRYLIPAFCMKMVGLVFAILVYVVYYKGSWDSITTYYSNICLLREIFSESYLNQIKYIIYGADFLVDFPRVPKRVIHGGGTAKVIQTGYALSFFCFNRFLFLSLFFTIIGFWGNWRMFVLFNKIFPSITTGLAFSFLFLPSSLMWTSGMMKEPLVFIGLAFLLEGFYNCFILGKKRITGLMAVLFGAWLILGVKAYIFLCIAPGLLIWKVVDVLKNIRDYKLKVVLIPILLGVLMIGLVGASVVVSSVVEDLAAEELTENIEGRMEHWNSREYGSSYQIPDIEFSVGGVLKSIPNLFVLGLMRPFIWESTKPIILVTGIETFAILLLTLYTFFKSGIYRSFKIIFSNPLLVGIIVYSLIFFPVVALTSGTFGTLVRYRVPCLPFFLMMIFVIHHQSKSKYYVNQNTLHK